MYRGTVTLSMIVKNEGKNLKKCLESVADLVDEIVIVDTGSTDDTVSIAKKFGAKIVPYEWGNDFAKARNAGIDKAKGDWIFWIDGDEYFEQGERKKLKKLFESLPDKPQVYMMNQINRVRDAPGEEIIFARPSLFRRREDVRWRYRVHEQILPVIQETGGEMVETGIRIQHFGYFEPDLHKHKVLRNIRLLHLEDNENPNDPFVIFHLGLMYQSLNRYAEAAPFWPQAIRLFVPGHAMKAKAYSLLTEALLRLNQLQDAGRVAEEGVRAFPDHPELLFTYGRLLATIGKIPEAEQVLQHLIADGRAVKTAASFNPGVLTYQPMTLLGEIYAQTGRKDLAVGEFERALELNPSYQPAIEGLNRIKNISCT